VVHDGQPQPPRYPPGFSLALTPFALLGGPYPLGAQVGARAFAVLYLLAVTFTAWRIGGPLAGALGAVLVGTAPFTLESAALVMSDALVAGVTVLVAGLLHQPTGPRAALAGALAGALLLVRLSAAVGLGSLFLALPGQLRRAALLALPGVVALAIFQWSTFGSPVRTGYDYWLPGFKQLDPGYAGQRLMGDGPSLLNDALNGRLMSWVCPCDVDGPMTRLPNVLFYPAVLFGPFWIFAPPFIGAIGLAYAVRHRTEPAASFALWLTLGSLAMLSVYFWQSARLVAAPAALLAVFGSVVLAGLIERAQLRLPVSRAPLGAREETGALSDRRPAP
jgi:hypothetical protein